ncbi:MAG: hypothetical protein ABI692_18525, partial [Terracoccus sp.]
MTTLPRTFTVAAATLALLAGSTTATLATSALASPAPADGQPAASSSASPASGYRWTMKPTGSDARFRGLAPVSKRVAWVSGTAGTVLRTVDGGATWQNVSPTGLGTEELQFRDIEAFDAQRAVILSIG